MAGTNPKLEFIKSIAAQSRRLEQEISTVMKSTMKNLETRPKPYYTIQDVEEIVNNLKDRMVGINKEAHTEFSKRGIRDIESIDLVQPESDSVLIAREELTQLRNEVDELRSGKSDTTSFEMKISDLELLLEEKEIEIAKLQDQSGAPSELVQEQLEELNRLQETHDETQRELKQIKLEKDKIESEYEIIGNTLMTTRLEVEELQTALGKKDIEIGNLKSEVQVLNRKTKEIISLKEKNQDLEKRFSTLEQEFEEELNEAKKSQVTKIGELDKENLELKKQLRTIKADMTELKEIAHQLEKENDELIKDSEETIEEALVVRNQLTEVKVDLEHKIKENEELNSRVITAEEQNSQLKNENSDLKKRVDDIEGTVEAENRDLVTQIEDLKTDLKSKEERISVIESSRNEIREKLANQNIEFEKQKSSILDLESQVKTKDRELTETKKDIESIRERHEKLSKDVDSSRAETAAFNREREEQESNIKNLTLEMEKAEKEKKTLNKKVSEYENELKKNKDDIESLNKQISEFEGESEKLRNAVEVLKINLSENPKYAILFVLQDIQQASIEELAKTVAIQAVFAERLIKELETEGWIEFNADQGRVTLKRTLLEID